MHEVNPVKFTDKEIIALKEIEDFIFQHILWETHPESILDEIVKECFDITQVVTFLKAETINSMEARKHAIREHISSAIKCYIEGKF